MKTLIHFSKSPFTFLPTLQYLVGDPYIGKPPGFWLSDENDHGWRQWCESEEWNLDGLAHVTHFECDTATWCVLTSDEEILNFTRDFRSIEHFPGLVGIEWRAVRKQFGGILISPYSWKLRMDTRTFWYYGWDCASACVWDLSTISIVAKAECTD